MALFGRHRIKKPVQGHATVLEPWLRNTDGASGNCRMKLELDVPGIEKQIVPYHEMMVTENRWPEEGMRVAVTVDADHPDRVEVDWDSVFGEMRGGILGYVAEGAASAVGVGIDLSRGVDDGVPQGKPADDYQEQIAALNAQFAAGQITYEEMADGVQRALGAK